MTERVSAASERIRGRSTSERRPAAITWRRLARRAIAAAVVLAITAFFTYLALRDVRYGDTWSALRESNYWWLVPALAVLAVHIALRALRWQVVFKPGRRPSFGAISKATLVGYLFNSI